MQRHELDGLTREELIAHAERLGVSRPRTLTQTELIDEIISRTAKTEREKSRSRGWLGRARDLLTKVIERGLHLPEAARALRGNDADRWPEPPPPLPTVTLAEIYAAQGHLDRAVDVLDEVLAQEPDHQEARALRERFAEQAQRPRTRTGRAAEERGAEESDAKAPAGEAVDPEAAAAVAEAVAQAVAAAPAAAVTPAPAAAAEEPQATSEPGAPSAADDEKKEALPRKRARAMSARDAESQPAGAAAGTTSLLTETTALAAKENKTGDDAGTTAPAVTPTETSAKTAETAETELPAGTAQTFAEESSAPVAAPSAEPAVSERAAEEPAAAAAEAREPGEQARTEAAPTTGTIDEDEGLPERYDVDEIVAIAVDPQTAYIYWEVRPVTLARALSKRPGGRLALRIVSVTPSWDGPAIQAWDVPIDALAGDYFARDIQPGANVRVSVGWLDVMAFEPFAIGAEVSAPRVMPSLATAGAVGQWIAKPQAPAAPNQENHGSQGSHGVQESHGSHGNHGSQESHAGNASPTPSHEYVQPRFETMSEQLSQAAPRYEPQHAGGQQPGPEPGAPDAFEEEVEEGPLEFETRTGRYFRRFSRQIEGRTVYTIRFFSWRGASEQYRLGASELYRAGSSELYELGGSELYRRGASNLSRGGASDMYRDRGGASSSAPFIPNLRRR